MRMGAKKSPFYRVVVKEKRSKRDGAYLENVGTYDPMQDPAEVNLKHDRIQYWIGVGAQPTDTVEWSLDEQGKWKANVRPQRQPQQRPRRLRRKLHRKLRQKQLRRRPRLNLHQQLTLRHPRRLRLLKPQLRQPKSQPRNPLLRKPKKLSSQTWVSR